MINVLVTGNEIEQSAKNCGVCGEGNSKKIIIKFDKSWEGYEKGVVFFNAHGENPVVILLTDANRNQNSEEETYEIYIPSEPLEYKGKIEYVVSGYKDNSIKKSVSGELFVRYSPKTDPASVPEEITPSQAEQLQEAITAAKNTAIEEAGKKDTDVLNSAKKYTDESLPTKVSELENDAKYTTMPDVEKKISEASSCVYIGSGDMPDDCHVQIDPNGEILTVEDIVNSVLNTLPKAEESEF